MCLGTVLKPNNYYTMGHLQLHLDTEIWSSEVSCSSDAVRCSLLYHRCGLIWPDAVISHTTLITFDLRRSHLVQLSDRPYKPQFRQHFMQCNCLSSCQTKVPVHSWFLQILPTTTAYAAHRPPVVSTDAVTLLHWTPLSNVMLQQEESQVTGYFMCLTPHMFIKIQDTTAPSPW